MDLTEKRTLSAARVLADRCVEFYESVFPREIVEQFAAQDEKGEWHLKKIASPTGVRGADRAFFDWESKAFTKLNDKLSKRPITQLEIKGWCEAYYDRFKRECMEARSRVGQPTGTDHPQGGSKSRRASGSQPVQGA